MPFRKTPLITSQVYHLFNRGINGMAMFLGKRTYSRFLLALEYYQHKHVPVKLSHFITLSGDDRESIFIDLRRDKRKLIDLYCYCLMPNHFHLLVKQTGQHGITTYMQKLLNSYSSYYNLVADRKGPLFQGPFKAVRIETDEQFFNVSRYIHINPYVGHVIERKNLLTYPNSSLPIYLYGINASIINTKPILGQFNTITHYRKFILDQADYKQSQENFKYLYLEE